MRSIRVKYICRSYYKMDRSRFTFAEDAGDFQGGDSSDYTDNALENLMRAAQK